MELRKEYVNELARLMRENDKIVILDADLAGAGGTKPLYKEFPDRWAYTPPQTAVRI